MGKQLLIKLPPLAELLALLLGLVRLLILQKALGGYLLYIVIGAFAGGAILGLAAAMLPWAIGLGLLVLILKACGVV